MSRKNGKRRLQDFLKAQIKASGLSQANYARAAGISPSGFCLVLSGRRGVSTLKMASLIANATGKTVTEIMEMAQAH